MAKASNNGQLKSEEKAPSITCVYLSYTPCHFSHDRKDYSLFNNETYELPNIPFVESLIGQGKLVKK
jgi:hypothetical protein